MTERTLDPNVTGNSNCRQGDAAKHAQIKGPQAALEGPLLSLRWLPEVCCPDATYILVSEAMVARITQNRSRKEQIMKRVILKWTPAILVTVAVAQQALAVPAKPVGDARARVNHGHVACHYVYYRRNSIYPWALYGTYSSFQESRQVIDMLYAQGFETYYTSR
jgi:hypothetical protein